MMRRQPTRQAASPRQLIKAYLCLLGGGVTFRDGYQQLPPRKSPWIVGRGGGRRCGRGQHPPPSSWRTLISLFGYYVACEAENDAEWYNLEKGAQEDMLATAQSLHRALKKASKASSHPTTQTSPHANRRQ